MRFLHVTILAIASLSILGAPHRSSPILEEVSQISVGAAHSARIRIPKINVDAPIQDIGITSSGELAAPTDPATAGWYEQGPWPGQIGSAVIDGHSGWKDRQPAIFDSLHILVPGDTIYVEDARGSITEFIVRKVKRFDPKADTASVFISNDGLAHLNLITCDGIWNAALHAYDDRLVIFADALI